VIKVTATVDDKGARSFLVDIGERVADRRALNQALGERFAEELQDHWRAKNAKPNKLGGRRTNFWAAAAAATAVSEVSDTGVTVAVQGEPGVKIRIHIFGGTIVPKVAQSLTIPIVREAYGMRVAEYEQQTGNELFSFGNVPLLFEKVDDGGTQSVIAGEGKKRGLTIPLARKQEIRPVYYLADSVEISRDPNALPDEDKLVAALQEEAEDWFDALEGGAL
jgi:hypothetical protein